MWSVLGGRNRVGVENGTIIGIVFDGVLVPIYNRRLENIKIRLLGIQQIELSPEEVRRLPFGRPFNRRTMIVNFLIHVNLHI